VYSTAHAGVNLERKTNPGTSAVALLVRLKPCCCRWPLHAVEYLLPGDREMAKDLEEMYGDIDAVEFVVGIFLESNRSHAMFAETMAEIGSPYSLKGKVQIIRNACQQIVFMVQCLERHTDSLL